MNVSTEASKNRHISLRCIVKHAARVRQTICLLGQRLPGWQERFPQLILQVAPDFPNDEHDRMLYARRSEVFAAALEYVQPEKLVKIIWLDEGQTPERQEAKRRCLAQAALLNDEGKLDSERFNKLFAWLEGEEVKDELRIITAALDAVHIEFHAEATPGLQE